MWCDNKNMLRDRVESYREVNEYNLHYDRHVIGPLRMLGDSSFEASYSLFQTDLEGNSRLFSVGRYRVEALLKDGTPRIKAMLVVADTGNIPSLLATPI
jgi:anthranilate 1,2-dioxygenase small subunit